MRFFITGAVPFGIGGCHKGFEEDGSMGMLLDTVVLSWGEAMPNFPLPR